MLILGVNRGNHDASACLVRDGVLLHFINAERVTRKRHEGTRVWEAVRYCLDAAGASPNEVDLVVQNAHTRDLDRFDPLIASQGVSSPASEFIRQFKQVRTISHHLAHAYSGIGLARFRECAVLVVDGIGQHLDGNRAEAESYYHYCNGDLRLLHARYGTLLPDGLGFHSFDSLGGVYSMVSSYLFGHWNYCGKVMGLAPYGHSTSDRNPIIGKDAPEFSINLDFRSCFCKFGANPAENWKQDVEASQNLAFTVQQELEQAVIQAARWLHNQTGSRNLIIAGGVALNCVANQKILDETPFERVFVPPPAGDDGVAVGCAFYGWLQIARGEPRFAPSRPYYGKSYGAEQIEKTVNREVLVEGHKPASLEADAARALAAGRVIGWFQGASAMGPRALGDRSILADPRNPNMRDHLNLNVKHREPFRPYGASVLEERAGEFFQTSAPCPYMTFAVQVRPDQEKKIPAVVHVDGTCRIQTVRREDHPRFHRLLSSFYELTGIPLVINTSLNGSGEPIVETPEEAIRLFLNMQLDSLVLEDYWIEQRFSARSRGQEKTLLNCRLLMERPLDLVVHLSPGGKRELSVKLSTALQNSVPVSEHAARVLQHAKRTGAVLGDVLKSCRIKAPSAGATALLKELVQLHKLGCVRLQDEQPRRRTPRRARRS
jgi:carbamoyltransferase